MTLELITLAPEEGKTDDTLAMHIRVVGAGSVVRQEVSRIPFTIDSRGVGSVDVDRSIEMSSALPNPTSGPVRIRLAEPFGRDASFRLVDRRGDVVMKGRTVPEGLELRLDLRYLPSGAYLVRIESGGQAVAQEVVHLVR